jgi:hypothetical protein
MSKAPTQSAINGIMHASNHPFPNNDLRMHGEKNGWPSRLFGEKRSEALVGAGITTFTQLMSEAKSRSKEQFYKDFGTCDGKVGVLDTSANTMYEVLMAWDFAQSRAAAAGGRGGAAAGKGSDTDSWLMHGDTHAVPDEDLSLGASGGWPKGALGPERVAKLKKVGITTTSQLMHQALTMSYDAFVARYGGRDGALDTRAGGFYGFLHRNYAVNA